MCMCVCVCMCTCVNARVRACMCVMCDCVRAHMRERVSENETHLTGPLVLQPQLHRGDDVVLLVRRPRHVLALPVRSDPRVLVDDACSQSDARLSASPLIPLRHPYPTSSHRLRHSPATALPSPRGVTRILIRSNNNFSN